MSTATATQSETVIYTADVAKAAREFARENGIEVGTRGRLSLEHFTRYFVAQPHTARVLAAHMGIPVSRRGRLAPADAEKIAVCVR